MTPRKATDSWDSNRRKRRLESGGVFLCIISRCLFTKRGLHRDFFMAPVFLSEAMKMTGYLEAYYPGGIFVRNRSECIRNGRVTPRRATDHQDSSSIGNLPFWFGRERWPGSVVIRLSYLSSGLPGPDYPISAELSLLGEKPRISK